MICFIKAVSGESATLNQDKYVSMELQISYKGYYIRGLLHGFSFHFMAINTTYECKSICSELVRLAVLVK